MGRDLRSVSALQTLLRKQTIIFVLLTVLILSVQQPVMSAISNLMQQSWNWRKENCLLQISAFPYLLEFIQRKNVNTVETLLTFQDVKNTKTVAEESKKTDKLARLVLVSTWMYIKCQDLKNMFFSPKKQVYSFQHFPFTELQTFSYYSQLSSESQGLSFVSLQCFIK